MKRIAFTTVTLLLCLAACSQNKSASDNKRESFETFLQRYNTDFDFQKSRTIFPFIAESYSTYDDDDETEGEAKTIVKLTNENEWEKVDFTWDPANAEREFDAFTQEISTVGDTTFIQYNGIENGINLKIIFVLKDNKWYLLKTIDNSM